MLYLPEPHPPARCWGNAIADPSFACWQRSSGKGVMLLSCVSSAHAEEQAPQGGVPSSAPGQGTEAEDDVALTVMPAWIQSVLKAQEEDALCERGATPGVSEFSASVGPHCTGQHMNASSNTRDNDEVTSTCRVPLGTDQGSADQQPGWESPRQLRRTHGASTGAASGTPCSHKSVAGMHASKEQHGSKRTSRAADEVEQDTSQ
jgi:hypothetical protein